MPPTPNGSPMMARSRTLKKAEELGNLNHRRRSENLGELAVGSGGSDLE